MGSPEGTGFHALFTTDAEFFTEEHDSIVSLVSLAANIAANHPKQGLCQLERLRDMGVPEAHIRTVIDIARHIRDEAGAQLDAQFDEKAEAGPRGTPAIRAGPAEADMPKAKPLSIPVHEGGACCTPTRSGKSCC